MMPSSVAMQRRKSLLPGVTKYASTRFPPRNVKPYSADNGKKILIDVAATLPQFARQGHSLYPAYTSFHSQLGKL